MPKSIWDTRFSTHKAVTFDEALKMSGWAQDADEGDDQQWITVRGAHILINGNGTVVGGAEGKFNGQKFVKAALQASPEAKAAAEKAKWAKEDKRLKDEYNISDKTEKGVNDAIQKLIDQDIIYKDKQIWYNPKTDEVDFTTGSIYDNHNEKGDDFEWVWREDGAMYLDPDDFEDPEEAEYAKEYNEMIDEPVSNEHQRWIKDGIYNHIKEKSDSYKQEFRQREEREAREKAERETRQREERQAREAREREARLVRQERESKHREEPKLRSRGLVDLTDLGISDQDIEDLAKEDPEFAKMKNYVESQILKHNHGIPIKILR